MKRSSEYFKVVSLDIQSEDSLDEEDDVECATNSSLQRDKQECYSDSVSVNNANDNSNGTSSRTFQSSMLEDLKRNVLNVKERASIKPMDPNIITCGTSGSPSQQKPSSCLGTTEDNFNVESQNTKYSNPSSNKKEVTNLMGNIKQEVRFVNIPARFLNGLTHNNKNLIISPSSMVNRPSVNINNSGGNLIISPSSMVNRQSVNKMISGGSKYVEVKNPLKLVLNKNMGPPTQHSQASFIKPKLYNIRNLKTHPVKKHNAINPLALYESIAYNDKGSRPESPGKVILGNQLYHLKAIKKQDNTSSDTSKQKSNTEAISNPPPDNTVQKSNTEASPNLLHASNSSAKTVDVETQTPITSCLYKNNKLYYTVHDDEGRHVREMPVIQLNKRQTSLENDMDSPFSSLDDESGTNTEDEGTAVKKPRISKSKRNEQGSNDIVSNNFEPDNTFQEVMYRDLGLYDSPPRPTEDTQNNSPVNFENNTILQLQNKNNNVVYNHELQSYVTYDENVLPQPVAENHVSKMSPVFQVFNKLIEDIKTCLHSDAFGNIPLHQAAFKNDLIKLKSQCIVLKTIGSHLNHINLCSETALMLAVKATVSTGDLAAVSTLLVEGADQFIADIEGDTPLHYAIRHGDGQLVRVLLTADDADRVIEKFNYEGLSPLHLAAIGGHDHIIKLLLNSKVDVNIKDRKYGRTPYFLAVEENSLTSAELLKAFGADINETNYADDPPPLILPNESSLNPFQSEFQKQMTGVPIHTNIKKHPPPKKVSKPAQPKIIYSPTLITSDQNVESCGNSESYPKQSVLDISPFGSYESNEPSSSATRGSDLKRTEIRDCGTVSNRVRVKAGNRNMSMESAQNISINKVGESAGGCDSNVLNQHCSNSELNNNALRQPKSYSKHKITKIIPEVRDPKNKALQVSIDKLPTNNKGIKRKLSSMTSTEHHESTLVHEKYFHGLGYSNKVPVKPPTKKYLPKKSLDNKQPTKVHSNFNPEKASSIEAKESLNPVSHSSDSLFQNPQSFPKDSSSRKQNSNSSGTIINFENIQPTTFEKNGNLSESENCWDRCSLSDNVINGEGNVGETCKVRERNESDIIHIELTKLSRTEYIDSRETPIEEHNERVHNNFILTSVHQKADSKKASSSSGFENTKVQKDQTIRESQMMCFSTGSTTLESNGTYNGTFSTKPSQHSKSSYDQSETKITCKARKRSNVSSEEIGNNQLAIQEVNDDEQSLMLQTGLRKSRRVSKKRIEFDNTLI